MSRQNPPTSSKSKKSRPTPAKANPALEKDVNALILDYLIVFAIDAALTAEEEGQGDAGDAGADPDGGKGEMADWFGRVLDAFGHLPLPDYTHNAVQGQAQRQAQTEMDVDMDMDMDMGAEMAPDLPIKIQILNILTSLRHTNQTQNQIQSQTNQPRIPGQERGSENFAQIGLLFMNLCLSALSKTHPAESRWMGISAEFLGLAIREHARTNPDPDLSATADPDDISSLKNWSSSNEGMDERWNLTWRGYIARSSSTAGGAGPDAGDVKKMAVSFIQDLMTTLDPPILLQLEGGKLGDLSFEETSDLLRRVGLPAGNGGESGGGGDEDEDEDGGGG